MIDEKRLIEDIDNKVAGLTNMQINKIMGIIDEQPKVGEWIPVSEELPKDNETSKYYDAVIVTLDNGRVVDGCYRNADKEWWVDAPSGHHFSENATGHVVAWMPYPEAYKG